MRAQRLGAVGTLLSKGGSDESGAKPGCPVSTAAARAAFPKQTPPSTDPQHHRTACANATMEDQAESLLATLKKSSAPIDQKLTQFNSLKSSIKHLRVPQECTTTIFECVRLAIAAQTSSTLVSTGFSTLGHLVKRLHLQSQTQITAQQSNQLLPVLLDRLGDARENHRNAASQALSDIWPYNHAGVESIVREGALGGTNSRAKEVAMQWVVKVRARTRARAQDFVV